MSQARQAQREHLFPPPRHYAPSLFSVLNFSSLLASSLPTTASIDDSIDLIPEGFLPYLPALNTGLTDAIPVAST